ncbi:hypothetical protein ABT124_34255 [Streptomyces sp. NPDC001982]|uniref:hypothetical protein n=1 Tax=Streptomyces sp. NPDC001982 TaxID=3154405 RepID=UPI003322B55C
MVLPFFWMVTPQLLPLPLGLATRTFSGGGTFIVTVTTNGSVVVSKYSDSGGSRFDW